MARVPIKITYGASLGEGHFTLTPFFGAGGAADATSVTADIAVLVADAASPTQAHVTTLNGHYTTFLAALAAEGVAAGDLAITIDTSVVTSLTKLRRGLDAILHQARNSGMFTA